MPRNTHEGEDRRPATTKGTTPPHCTQEFGSSLANRVTFPHLRYSLAKYVGNGIFTSHLDIQPLSSKHLKTTKLKKIQLLLLR